MGLIVSGACGVMYPVGQVQEWQVALSEDVHIPGLRRVVESVHEHGAKFEVQLQQGGLNAVDDTVAGARRAIQAGCDAVEIHGGYGYVPSSFLSPRTNQRTDEYGGSLENRARLLLEILRAVRAETGPDYPIIVKIDSREVGKEGGITLDDAVVTAKWLEESGANAITVSAYHDFGKGKMHSASNVPHEPNTNLPAATAIKKALTIPD